MSGESQSGGGFRPGPILLDVTPFATEPVGGYLPPEAGEHPERNDG